MSFQGTIEFAIHAKRFYNLDLFEPGFYNLQTTIYQQVNKKKTSARPFSIIEKSSTEPPKGKWKPVIKSCILSTAPTYVTRTFAVSLCEEEINFNELCCFKFDFNDLQKNENSSFILEIDLMFADYATYSELHGSSETKLAGFRKICTYKAAIKTPEEGAHEYIPILFDYRHSCVFEMFVQTTTSNLRFKPEKTIAQPNQTGNDNEDQLIIQSRLLRKMLNKTAAITLQTLKDFYKQYLIPLKKSYKRLIEYYAYVLNIFMRESTHKEYSKYLNGAPSMDNMREELIHYKIKEGRPTVRPSSSPNKAFEEEKTLTATNVVESFSEMLNSLESQNPDSVLFNIAQDMMTLNGKIFNAWLFLNEMILELPRQVIMNINKDHYDKLRITFNEKLSKKIYRTSDPVLVFEQNIGENHNKIAAFKRANKSFKELDSVFSVEEVNCSSSSEFQPVVFEEICVKEQLRSQINNEVILSKIEQTETKQTFPGVHLIVLCHGFQGSSNDLRLLKNTISYMYPDTAQLCASANEDLTDGEISSMGARLATEVKNYLKEWIPDASLGRLSFIGHSLGGVIIRAALPHLEDYANKMHLFMTFSSPHLGYMQNSSVVFDAGMWFLKQIKRNKCLKELTLTDASNIEDTYIFKLSKMKGLGWFKHIMLLSSFQDNYAPFESTRIQMSKKTMPDENKQILYEQMANNILSNVSADCIYRTDINFYISERNLDSMLGRTAHIQFLECKYLTKMLVNKYVDFFS